MHISIQILARPDSPVAARGLAPVLAPEIVFEKENAPRRESRRARKARILHILHDHVALPFTFDPAYIYYRCCCYCICQIIGRNTGI